MIKNSFQKSKIAFLISLLIFILPTFALAKLMYNSDIYAKNFYSSLTWQNNTLMTNMFDNIQRVDLSKPILIGANYNTSQKDDFTFNDSSLYFGFSKKIAYTNRLAFLVLVAKSNVDLSNNNGSKDDDTREVSMILQHKHFNKAVSKLIVFVGRSQSKTSRNSFMSRYSGGLANKASYENRFAGADVSFYKNFHFSSMYFRPETNLYFSYLAQGDINEDENGGVSIAKTSFLSLKPTADFELGKNFIKTRSSTLNIALNIGFSYELADPNKSLESTSLQYKKTENISSFSNQGIKYNFGGNLNYIYKKFALSARTTYSASKGFSNKEFTYGFNIGYNF